MTYSACSQHKKGFRIYLSVTQGCSSVAFLWSDEWYHSRCLFFGSFSDRGTMSSCHERQLWWSFVVYWSWDSHAAVEHTFEALKWVVQIHVKCEVDENISHFILHICSVIENLIWQDWGAWHHMNWHQFQPGYCEILLGQSFLILLIQLNSICNKVSYTCRHSAMGDEKIMFGISKANKIQLIQL